METIGATEANNTEQLRKETLDGPNASVPPPATSEKPTAGRRGVRAGFAKGLFVGVDMNALLDTSIEDAFEGYI